MEDDKIELGQLDQGNTILTLFKGKGPDLGFVGLVLRGAPLVMIGGEPFPAIRMSPEQARNVALELMEYANKVEEEPG